MPLFNRVDRTFLPKLLRESLNGDGQQFHQYQQTKQSPFNSNYKRKFKRWWSTIPLISTITSHWTQKMTTTYDVWNPDLGHGCFYCKTWRYFNERYLIMFHALYNCYGHVYIFYNRHSKDRYPFVTLCLTCNYSTTLQTVLPNFSTFLLITY